MWRGKKASSTCCSSPTSRVDGSGNPNVQALGLSDGPELAKDSGPTLKAKENSAADVIRSLTREDSACGKNDLFHLRA